MKKYAVVGVLIVGLSLVISDAFAGGRERIAAGEEIGIPPAPRCSGLNIARDRGKGELFYPGVDFLSRIITHRMVADDKKPGPGWGVPEGHNIGNAPGEHVIGKYIDRTERGKFEFVTDFFGRIAQHEKNKRKSK